MTIRLGISTCPNDTFAFHALAAGEVDSRGLDFQIDYLDVQELNERMIRGGYDIAKVSFHAAIACSSDWLILPSGSALGFGVGPLVLGSRKQLDTAPSVHDSATRPLVLCPGRWTTATLLWRLFHPEDVRMEQAVFSEIIPALEQGRADLGVCIHEARFVWRQHGLDRVEDLGETWEAATGAPLPLGGIAGQRSLGPDVLGRVQEVVRASIDWGLAHRDACVTSMRAHAQEESDDVLWKHVDLYVNDWTVDLGATGRNALRMLARLAHERGLLSTQESLEVLSPD